MENITKETLLNLHSSYEQKFSELKEKKLSLDMTRGKPGSEQLQLTNTLDGLLEGNYLSDSGVDTRNYGGLDGLIETKELFSKVLSVEVDETIIGGNSSLTLMYQYIDLCHNHGILDKDSAWKNITAATFICPVPGYDRHFAICEFMGIKMIPLPLNEDGPDLNLLENIVKNNSSVCGIWAVPKYSNPGGVVYSDDNIKGICEILKNTRSEFRLMWDNAYALHDLIDKPKELAPILKVAKELNVEDKVVLFGSTSKITFAGAGVSFCGMSKKNVSSFLNYLSYQTIGPDKVNQLRHLRFFNDFSSLKNHMNKHKEILLPKFNAVLSALESEFTEYPFLKWTKPEGGYFISVDTLPGLASEVVSLCAEMGVKITPAGATYPYGKDPNNSNIRLAPSFPSIDQIKLAMKAFTTAVGLSTTKKLLS